MEETNINHVPVLYQEIIDLIKPEMQSFFDGTFGYGGHSIGIIKKFLDYKNNINNLTFVATDMDHEVYNIGLQNIHSFLDSKNLDSKLLSQNISQISKINIYNTGYHNIPSEDYSSQLPKFDFILLDLGANMHHFKKGDRGFSIKLDGELDMRYNQNTKLTAKTIINERKTDKIAEILNLYGDFSLNGATKIANHIYSHRKSKTINNTNELTKILFDLGLNNTKIAVVFQCIRIAVNDEFGNITRFLDGIDQITKSGSTIAIITFHSLEDKLVKYKLVEYLDSGKYEAINKHVIKPSFAECKKNPASRSAKLRIIKKT